MGRNSWPFPLHLEKKQISGTRGEAPKQGVLVEGPAVSIQVAESHSLLPLGTTACRIHSPQAPEVNEK